MEVDFLEAIQAERREQRRRYLLALREALQLGNLRPDEKSEFDRIERAVSDLTARSEEEEKKIDALRETNRDEYVTQMTELCDHEAKEFAQLTGELRALVHEVRLRRASQTIG